MCKSIMGHVIYVGGGVGGPGGPGGPVRPVGPVRPGGPVRPVGPVGPVRPGDNIVYQPPPWVQMNTPAPPSQFLKGPEEWTVPEKVTLGNTHIHVQTIMERPTATVLNVSVNKLFLIQWTTTLTSSFTCPEVTWTSASTSTLNLVIFSTWCLTGEQVQEIYSKSHS